jgi:putative ABC transport system permease protein
MLVDHVLLALRQVRGRWLESSIVALGIALGTGLAVGILGIVTSYLADRVTAQGAPQLRVLFAQSSLNTYSGMQAVERIGTATTPEVRFRVGLLDKAKASCPAVAHAWVEMERMLRPGGDTSREFPARATTEDYFGAYGLAAAQGSAFSRADVDLGRRVLVLGAGLAKRLQARVGKEIRASGFPYMVIGILAPDPDPEQDQPWGRNSLAYLPVTATPNAVRPDWGRLWFSVKTADRISPAVRQLQDFFQAELGAGAVTVGSEARYFRDYSWRMGPLLTMVSVMACLALLVSAVNGTNIMLLQVVRRTRALGVVRALGASRLSLGLQVTTESVLLGACGGLAGAAFALALQDLVRTALSSGNLPGAGSTGLPAAVIVSASLGLALGLSLLLSVYPAVRAGRTNSASALRED